MSWVAFCSRIDDSQPASDRNPAAIVNRTSQAIGGTLPIRLPISLPVSTPSDASTGKSDKATATSAAAARSARMTQAIALRRNCVVHQMDDRIGAASVFNFW